ncbi:hypothetical protein [Parasitella parasitica]|uniref:Uncharacterized protein n=1 Tax=Parasitella parasitica TaxID=35722 RepID=A0A0B7MVE5_9FUNG|nr:hypothetical protein [Parasitella parasitica]
MNNSDDISNAEILALFKSLFNQSSQAPSNSGPLLRVADPTRFSGQRDIAIIDAWILSMERYLSHYKIDPCNWISNAIHFLDGRAILWSVQEYVNPMQDILLEATDITQPKAIDHFIRHLKPQLFAKKFVAYLLMLLSLVVSPDPISPTSAFFHDPMDLSVITQNLFCEWCKRKGHIMDNFHTKAYATRQFER